MLQVFWSTSNPKKIEVSIMLRKSGPGMTLKDIDAQFRRCIYSYLALEITTNHIFPPAAMAYNHFTNI